MVELPKDADGVPIHEGDKMYLDDGRTFVVTCIKFVDNDNPYFYLTDVNRDVYLPSGLTHTRPDSLGRIAEDLKDWGETEQIAGCPDAHDCIAYFVDRIRKLAKKEGERWSGLCG